MKYGIRNNFIWPDHFFINKYDCWPSLYDNRVIIKLLSFFVILLAFLNPTISYSDTGTTTIIDNVEATPFGKWQAHTNSSLTNIHNGTYIVGNIDSTNSNIGSTDSADVGALIFIPDTQEDTLYNLRLGSISGTNRTMSATVT